MPELRRAVAAIFLFAFLISAPGALAHTEKKSPPGAAEKSGAHDAAKPGEAPAAKSMEAKPAPSAELLAAVEQLRAQVEQQSKELEAQRAALREQQQKMAALEQQLLQMARADSHEPSGVAASGEASAPTADDAASAEAAQLETQVAAVSEKVTKLEAGLAAANKASEGKFRQLGNFSFSGDLRARWEPTWGGGLASGPSAEARHRERFRLRFNANAKFSDELTGGFTLASGDEFDPISSNQTFTNFFTRKFVAIDRAFVQYNPRRFKPLTLVAGKFAYTWQRTEMTLDNDLNPEGISEVLAFDVKNPVFQKFVVVGFQLPFNEVTSGKDSFMSGAQVQTHWRFGERVKFGGYVAFYDFAHADSVRAAQTTRTLTGGSATNAGTLSQLASKFAILDVMARADVSTGSARWPLLLLFNFANNTRPCANLPNITGTPPACNPRDRSAFWAEFQLGQTHETRDISFGYTFMRIEREAVIAGFNFSDIRQPTNMLSHRVQFNYQVHRHVIFTTTGLFGRALSTATSPPERIARRVQVDVIYKF